MLLIPFDSHNHVHMGPSAPVLALFHRRQESPTTTDPLSSSSSSRSKPSLSGMALMSTHPRDYSRVLQLSHDIPRQFPVQVVPCIGVHPWFLHELTDAEWVPWSAPSSSDPSPSTGSAAPKWIVELERQIMANPNAIVGEIGLDGFHFDPLTKDLVSPMDRQVVALSLQLEVAARHQRPVSVHCVQAFGPLWQVLSNAQKRHTLPPKLYFHAFGGKVGTLKQLLALLCRNKTVCYFGFAPIVNFRSPKTVDLVRHIGLDRLLLESDHEDASLVVDSINECVSFYAQALGIDEQAVVDQTTRNAADFYELNLPVPK